MPEHLRALIAILLIATPLFAFAKPAACAVATATADFERRRNLWFALTLAAFLAHSFWIFIVLAAALLLHTLPRERNKLALFFFLLFAVPAIPAEIPGFGLMRQLFAIDYPRLLALAVLLPAFLYLRRQPDVEPFGRLLPDLLLAGYLVLLFFLQLPHETFTETLRTRVFYAFTDVFLPYYVASRSLRNLPGFRDALMAFAVAALVLAAIACFEAVKGWLLYAALDQALGINWVYGAYLLRGDGLRAQATAGHPISLGYIMAVATGLALALRSLVPSATLRGLGFALLLAGLIAPLSRGPWVGAAVILAVFVALGPAPVKRFATLGVLGGAIVSALVASPVGRRIVDYLPFVGTVEAENITYRERLFEISLDVIRENLLFGAYDAISLPVMQQLKQGQGIIDIVNTYVGVALGSGIVGLALFACFFVVIAARIFAGMRSLPDRNDERYLLGQALLSTLIGILVIIFTVSSITIIALVYWSIAGLGVAYARMLAQKAQLATASRPGLVKQQLAQ